MEDKDTTLGPSRASAKPKGCTVEKSTLWSGNDTDVNSSSVIKRVSARENTVPRNKTTAAAPGRKDGA